jgi:regulator of sigma D
MAVSSTYSGVPVEISSTLTINFPVDKLVDEFVANMYDIIVDFDKESKSTIQKRLYDENNIPTVDEPGISTLIDALIRLIIKAIGTFAQQVFTITELVKKLKVALKNPTSTSNASYISSIPNKIKEIMKEAVQIFTDTANWIIKKFLGALSKINIPIPEFSFDILGFELKISKIDNKGLIKSKFTIPAKENSDLSSLQTQIKNETIRFTKNYKSPKPEMDQLSNSLQPELNTAKVENDNIIKLLAENEAKLKISNTKVDALKNKKNKNKEETSKYNNLKTENTLLKAENKELKAKLRKSNKRLTIANSNIKEQNIKIDDKLKGGDDKKKLNELKQKLDNKLENNPVSAFTETIKKLIIGIIKFPIDFLVDLFKQLIDTLTGILSFDFSGFEKLIKMMKPSVDSVKKLIVSVLDTIISGFSKLYDNVIQKFGKGKKDKKKKEEINEHLKKNGLGIMGWSNTEENIKKLNKLIAFFNIALNITDAFSQLFISLIIELFNYALEPVGIKVG